MARSVPAPATTAAGARLAAFVLERFPFAITAVQRALDASPGNFRQELEKQLRTVAVSDLPETTPGVSARDRLTAAVEELLDAVDGFLARDAIASSLTKDEKLEMLRGMVLMRALDNRLKQFYLQPEVKYGTVGVQGKGFRSFG